MIYPGEMFGSQNRVVDLHFDSFNILFLTDKFELLYIQNYKTVSILEQNCKLVLGSCQTGKYLYLLLQSQILRLNLRNKK